MCQILILNKVAGCLLQLYLKRVSGTGVFLRVLQKFCKEYLFYRIPLVAAFDP